MNGFTDLRPNVHHASQQAEESFWPSFTDLMMVVVMIFLVTTSALYIRNWQLVQEMSAMIESERLAREMAQQSMREQGNNEQELSRLNNALSAAESESSELRLSLSEAKESLRILQMMRDALSARNSRQTAELSAAETSREQLIAQLSAEQQRADSASNDLRVSKNLLTLLQQAQVDSGQSLKEMKIDFDATTDRLVQLRAEYTTLKDKYDKLLRPARSASGKYVVTLRHGKSNGTLYYEMRLPEDNSYSRVSEAEMHERLSGLLDAQGDQLFLRLVYPKTSGLSYDEAYRYSNSVLKKYDYYYREQPLDEQLNGE